jgi:molybdopterin-biosynthesis enzyme MoeA-like protein
MNFGLIIIGDEILSGRRQDKHMARVIEMLAARGLALSWVRYLGDEPARITQALREAMSSGDVVFSCGGIGATPDDHTRQCAAEASEQALMLHPEAKALIEERMQDVARERGEVYQPDREDNVHRLNMGVFPAGARIIPNPYNKIPGFSVGDVHFVPGFPVMAHPMIEWVLSQQYAHLAPLAHEERSLYVYNGLEASLTPLMLEVEQRFAGVKIFSLPSVDHPQRGRHIELGVKGSPEGVAGAFEFLQQALAAMTDLRVEMAG